MAIQIDLTTSQYGTPFSGDTFLEQCYSWVMTQDDMAGSVAV